MKRNILIIGATSAIAHAAAKKYAAAGNALFLVARNENRLKIIAEDLRVRGATKVEYETLDLNHFEQHEALLKNAIQALGSIDIALIAHGSLPNQKNCEHSFATTHQELMTNYLSAVSLLTYLANYFETKKSGSIAVISSVAGDRGRQSNYIYGSAKGALSIYLQGLRNRLTKSNVHVLTIKPGFVDTPMTADFKKGLLWAKPDFVADKIMTAIDKKRNVIYVPFFWKQIMCLIKSIPEKIFNKMSL